MGSCFLPLPLPPLNYRQNLKSAFPANSIAVADRGRSRFLLEALKLDGFLGLKPELKHEFLKIDLPSARGANPNRFDVLIIGTGPAGLCLAERVSRHGIKVCCIDPSPLSMWPNNYAVWVDELHPLGLQDCLDKTWPRSCVLIDDSNSKYLDRAYGRVDKKKLKTKLLENSVGNGVMFHKSKVLHVCHEEFESFVKCEDGKEFKANLVVDAGGFWSDFMKYDKPRNNGYQIAYGILAEVNYHPFDLDRMVLMDLRDSHLGNEPYLRMNNLKFPTFLYAMPFSSTLVFLQETSLVSRPALPFMEVKKRMVARLRHLGIEVKVLLEDEMCVIPMGGPLPRIPQNVVGFGGAAGLVHPSTGYMVARALALASDLGDSIAECLGSIRMVRGNSLYRRVWNDLWDLERRQTREFYIFGMEILLKLDLRGIRGFFDAFFDLDPCYWQGFLSSRLSIAELASLGLSLFGHASNCSRVDIITKSPIPLAKMVGDLVVESMNS